MEDKEQEVGAMPTFKASSNEKKDKIIPVRMDQELLRKIEEYQRKNDEPDRSKAIRAILAKVIG